MKQKFNKLIYCLFTASIALSSTSLNAQSCFDIKSILVDACGTPEGENEMVLFKVGSADLNVSALTVTWPNNPYLGICQNPGTAITVATLNSTIQGCGIIYEPTAGILPANSSVLLVTSTAMNPSFNSFSNLNDTIYMIFQCIGNTGGHFKNYQAGAGTRTLIMSFGATCNDTVVYAVDSLRTQTGAIGGQDGATVLYDASGIASYINNGCQAPVNNVISFLSASDTTVCPNDQITINANIVSGNYTSFFWAGGNGVFGNALALATTYQTSSSFSGIDNLIFGIVSNCNDTLFDTLSINIGTGAGTILLTTSGPTTFCSGDSVTITASGAAPYLWSTGQTTTSITVTTGGTYSVTGTGGCGSVIDSVIVTVITSAVTSVTPNGPTTFCQGDSVVLTASGASSYLWSTGQTSASITVSTSGSYTVTGTSSCGTSNATLSVQVNQFPVPAVSLSGPLTFCQGDSVVLTASGGTNYLWSTGAIGTTITAFTTNTYTVTISNLCGSVSTSVTTTVNPLPTSTLNVTGPTSLCAGDSAIISTTGIGTYQWSTGATTNNIVVNTPGTYTLTVTNGCGSSSSSQTFGIGSTPNLNIVGSSTTICPGDSVTLFASGGSSYLWSTGATTSQIVVYASSTYLVTATNGCGSTQGSSFLPAASLPTAAITASGSTIVCPGSSLTLTANGTGNILWNTGATSQSISILTAGTYILTITNNCGSSVDSVNIDLSTLDADYIPNVTSGVAPLSVDFLNTSTNANAYSWNFGDNSSSSTDTNATHTFVSSGSYPVTLTATDTNGCVSTYVDTIEVINSELYIPNVFSPNGDNVNEEFNVQGEGITGINGLITNRWGKEIATWNTLTKGWNGNSSDGEKVPAGVYFYIIQLNYANGTVKKLNGHVTVVR
jgi:gliding motility-associated-like protein